MTKLPMWRRNNRNSAATAATAVGVIASIFVAGLLESARNGIGPTNVAVILTFVVVAASSMGDRITGLVVGVVAALSYNFFHTQPYRTLRISSGKDILTVCLLAITGIFVGTAVRAALVADLGVGDVHFEPVCDGFTANAALPSISVNGTIEGASLTFEHPGFTLPPEGVTVPVAIGTQLLGRLVLIPGSSVGTTGERRRTAVALAQQLAIALPRDGALASPR